MTTPEQRSPNSDHWDCAMIRDLLPLFIDDEVSPDSKSLIVEHLANCTHCADFLASAQSIQGNLAKGKISRRSAKATQSSPVQQMHSATPAGKSAAIQLLLGVSLLSIGIVWLGVYLMFFISTSAPIPMPTSTPFYPYPSIITNSRSTTLLQYPTIVSTPTPIPQISNGANFVTPTPFRLQ